MDIDEIRRINIEKLQKEAGSPSVIAEKLGMSYAQYVNTRDGAVESKTGKRRGIRKETAWRFEDAFNKPRGWLDTPHIKQENEVEYIGGVKTFFSEDKVSEEMVEIPEANIRFSAGHGAEIHPDENGEPALYRRAWFREMRLKPEQCKRFKVQGNSMEPLLFNNDSILVNLAETEVISGKIYALCYGEKLLVKRVFAKLDGSLVLKSENKDYSEETIDTEAVAENVQIIGRVREKSGSSGF